MLGGLPEDLQFELVEPLKMLFKDEVRVVRRRHWACQTAWYTASRSPAPAWACVAWAQSPATAWKPYGSPTPSCARSLPRQGLEGQVWQYFTVVPDFKSVGVRDGNARCFDWPVIIRAVNTVDAMTATVPQLPLGRCLQTITDRILQRSNRRKPCAATTLSPKPTATIEWE